MKTENPREAMARERMRALAERAERSAKEREALGLPVNPVVQPVVPRGSAIDAALAAFKQLHPGAVEMPIDRNAAFRARLAVLNEAAALPKMLPFAPGMVRPFGQS